jgi:cell division transport system permease protein
LPGIIALMVYLSAMILVSGFTLNQTINNSYNAHANSFSVNIPYIPLSDKENEITQKIITILKENKGIIKAVIVEKEQIKQMVAPWLGNSDAILNLNLPIIIEAQSYKDAVVDFVALKKQINAIAGGVTIDNHQKWINEFAGFISAIRIVLIIIAIIILAATGFMVIFTCKTSLKIHRSSVALLHRLGAMDGYIAKQFQQHCAILTFKGALIGSFLAAFTLIVFHITARHINSPLFPSFDFSIFHWLILLLLPIITSLIAGLAARLSVLKSLTIMH